MIDYKESKGYKILIALGCKDTTGPILKKRGAVALTKQNTGTLTTPYYHFDPVFETNNRVVTKASRKQRGAETVYVYKDPGDYLEDFELACSAFIVNMLGFRIPKDNDFTKEIFDELVNRNKSKIFYMIFEGDIL